MDVDVVYRHAVVSRSGEAPMMMYRASEQWNHVICIYIL